MPISNELNNTIALLNNLDEKKDYIVSNTKTKGWEKQAKTRFRNFLGWFIHLITFTFVPRIPGLDKLARNILDHMKNELEKSPTVSSIEKRSLKNAVRKLGKMIKANGGSEYQNVKKFKDTVRLKSLDVVQNLGKELHTLHIHSPIRIKPKIETPSKKGSPRPATPKKAASTPIRAIVAVQPEPETPDPHLQKLLQDIVAVNEDENRKKGSIKEIGNLLPEIEESSYDSLLSILDKERANALSDSIRSTLIKTLSRGDISYTSRETLTSKYC